MIRRNFIIILFFLMIIGLIFSIASVELLSVRGKTIITSKNLSIYEDSECIFECTGISWGTINTGESISKTIFIKNTGNSKVTLSMSTSVWSSNDAQLALTLSWNRNNFSLQSGKIISAIITLTASEEVTKILDFSFTITISGT